MKPRLRICRRYSAAEAVEALGRFGDEAKVLAGGQSLIPMLALRLARPSALVDINRCGDLEGLAKSGGTLTVGALVRQRHSSAGRRALAALPRGAGRGGPCADQESRNGGGKHRPRGSRLRAARAPPLPRRLGDGAGQGRRARDPRGQAVPRAPHHLARRGGAGHHDALQPAPRRLGLGLRRGGPPPRRLRARGMRGGAGPGRRRLRIPCAIGILRSGRHASPERAGRGPSRRPRAHGRPPGRGGPRRRLGLSPDGDIHASAAYRKTVAAVLAERVLAAALDRCRKPA